MASIRRLFLRGFLFAIPFVLVMGIVAITDPYNYFSENGLVDTNEKIRVAYPLNYVLWKVIAFNRFPESNLLLGDSRMNLLLPSKIKKQTGDVYASMSYGSGTLPEICETFWFAVEKMDLKRVYIGISLNHFALSNAGDRVTPACAALHNPLLYLVNRNVLKATGLILKNKLRAKGASSKHTDNIDSSHMTKEKFWEYQLTVTTKRYYGNFVYATEFLCELQKVSNYCKEEGIVLTFVILPTHTDLQEAVLKLNLLWAKERFLDDLNALGKVINLNVINDLTKNADNFGDPYHFNKETSKKVVEKIWGTP